VKKYNISDENVQSFLQSMKNDLKKTEYKTKSEIDEYIYGSADVVGLMCLNVFCDGDYKKIEKLEYPAMKLGSAFQKVNFLRDFKDDVESLDRKYFPNVDRHNFNEKAKSEIINEIENDFKEAYKGIKQLPSRSRLAVLLAYYYYNKLLNKLKYTPANKIIEARIRVSNITKLLLLFKASTVYKLNLM